MIRLHWAVHNHQPVGNFDFIFERAYGQAYRPFLDALRAHPRVRMSMHFSGILLDWLEAKRPEYLADLRKRVDRGQVEILGGGYYEPILPVISDDHKRRQLDKLQAAVKRLFGVTPRGLWLAERVWEPTLVKPICEAGLEYVLLDGSHFKMVGKQDEDLDGYFLSEDQGQTLKLFPIHDVIRDFIPFRPVEEVMDALLRLDVADRDVQVVFGDDGEKFGDWPGTHTHVYGENRWLHRFFEAVEALPDRIRMEPMAEALRPGKNLGLVYLPPASYQEMMIWAQDARDTLLFRKSRDLLIREGGAEGAKFLRGTFWRNFFNKYPESNQMHKQGLRLARDLERYGGKLSPKTRGQVLDHILQAQCNCAYWHGVFGGLYLPHLRFALYRNLIQAQRLLDRVLFSAPKAAPAKKAPPKGKPRLPAGGGDPIWDVTDWNDDGQPEYTLNSPEIYLSLTAQGEADQIWLKRTGLNLTDTLTRRFEAYHENLGGGQGGAKLENQLTEKEANLGSYLHYDQRTRHTLTDLYLSSEVGLNDYLPQTYRPLYRFQPEATRLQRGAGETAACFFGWGVPCGHHAAGMAHGQAKPKPAFRVEKRIGLVKGKRPHIRVRWSFSSESDEAISFRFGCEALFCLLAGNAPDRYIDWEAGAVAQAAARGRDILAYRGELVQPSRLTVADEWLRLRCEVAFPGAARLWRDAVETVSQSEGGYERVYQGTVVVPLWDIRMEPGGGAEVALSIQISEGV